MTAPSVIPKRVEIVHEDVPQFGPAAGVVGGTGDAGLLGGLIGNSAPPPPPPPKGPSRIRVGGAVEAASLLRQVQPIYPPIAKTAHISGTVILHAVIGKDGSVQELEYVSGPSLLMKAAMDAVKDWRYKPLLLNGEPTEVETEISVIFTLSS
jgi:protein TonB